MAASNSGTGSPKEPPAIFADFLSYNAASDEQSAHRKRSHIMKWVYGQKRKQQREAQVRPQIVSAKGGWLVQPDTHRFKLDKHVAKLESTSRDQRGKQSTNFTHRALDIRLVKRDYDKDSEGYDDDAASITEISRQSTASSLSPSLELARSPLSFIKSSNSIDPFSSLPLELDSTDQHLVQHYLITMPPELFGTRIGGKFETHRAITWPFALENESALRWILIAAESNICHRSQLSPTPSLLQRKAEAYRYTNETLAQCTTYTSDFLLLTILSAALAEGRYADTDVSRVHAIAMNYILDLRGGWKSLSHNLSLNAAVTWAYHFYDGGPVQSGEHLMALTAPFVDLLRQLQNRCLQESRYGHQTQSSMDHYERRRLALSNLLRPGSYCRMALDPDVFDQSVLGIPSRIASKKLARHLSSLLHLCILIYDLETGESVSFGGEETGVLVGCNSSAYLESLDDIVQDSFNSDTGGQRQQGVFQRPRSRDESIIEELEQKEQQQQHQQQHHHHHHQQQHYQRGHRSMNSSISEPTPSPIPKKYASLNFLDGFTTLLLSPCLANASIRKKQEWNQKKGTFLPEEYRDDLLRSEYASYCQRTWTIVESLRVMCQLNKSWSLRIRRAIWSWIRAAFEDEDMSWRQETSSSARSEAFFGAEDTRRWTDAQFLSEIDLKALVEEIQVSWLEQSDSMATKAALDHYGSGAEFFQNRSPQQQQQQQQQQPQPQPQYTSQLPQYERPRMAHTQSMSAPTEDEQYRIKHYSMDELTPRIRNQQAYPGWTPRYGLL